MASQDFSYIAQRFHPRETEQPLLLFVAPAGDIRTWAGVPRKAFDYLHGFQRTLQPERVLDVARFFGEDRRNVSPTAVVVGLRSSVAIVALTNPATSDKVDLVEVRISAPDYEATPIEDIAEEALRELEQRLAEDAVRQVRERTEEAIVEASRLEDEDAVDQATGAESGSQEDFRQLDRSYLEDFYAQLFGYVRRVKPWPSDERALRDVLYSILKPAIIVDGQHRVFGAAELDESMLLAVCAVPNSNWAENVYQFVVINQKAKPIKPAFLSSIIATSLSDRELRDVYKRLRTSNVDVERSETMERINSNNESPFYGMIDFEVQGSSGFLSFPGMWRLASDFANIESSYAVLLPDGNWDDVEGGWLKHFFSLWSGVRDYFMGQDSRLWQKPTEGNPNNLLKIVALQEVQGLMLGLWADARSIKFHDPQETYLEARKFWDGFPATFFTDVWQQKGLQTQVGRGILRTAMQETRRNHGRKYWGHRKLLLFREGGS